MRATRDSSCCWTFHPGVAVGIVALPLAIAFAIASAVTPNCGSYTAIIAGFLISLLGGSRVQIGGPTGAFIVIVYGIVQQYGVEGLLAATIMAGIFLSRSASRVWAAQSNSFPSLLQRVPPLE